MPAPSQTVRVLISSNFRDMQWEGDHLVTVVFPELRERVERLGLEFFDEDLRWSVPARGLNGETANSWEHCRQWIDRVDRFFLLDDLWACCAMNATSPKKPAVRY